jgi:hypothetical protein
VWAATGNATALPAALAAGVLPDLDHIPDYYLRFVQRDWRYLIIPFHGWEYAAAALVIYLVWVPEPWMLAALLGYLTQIGGDQLFNRPRWHTYFITARALRKFRAEPILGRTDYTGYRAVVHSVPFGKDWVKRWFESRLPGQRG